MGQNIFGGRGNLRGRVIVTLFACVREKYYIFTEWEKVGGLYIHADYKGERELREKRNIQKH